MKREEALGALVRDKQQTELMQASEPTTTDENSGFRSFHNSIDTIVHANMA